MKNQKEELNNFIKTLYKKAYVSGKNESSFRYPYKPALLLAIIQTIKVQDLFNKEISLNSPGIIEKYYDYISLNFEFYEYIQQNEKSKKNWSLGIKNPIVKKNVLKNIENMPAKKLSTNNNFWFFDEKKNIIKMTYDFLDNNKEHLKDFLLSEAIKSLKECYPKEYNLMEKSSINDFKEMVYFEYINEQKDVIKHRGRIQHLFAKEVKDRDGKCIICCLDIPELLEACHIKPYSKCKDNQNEAIDKENGITLCRNHHKLFDSGFFTFKDDWKINANDKRLIDKDHDLFLRQHEPCYSKTTYRFPYNNKYLKYHKLNIFNK